MQVRGMKLIVTVNVISSSNNSSLYACSHYGKKANNSIRKYKDLCFTLDLLAFHFWEMKVYYEPYSFFQAMNANFNYQRNLFNDHINGEDLFFKIDKTRQLTSDNGDTHFMFHAIGTHS